MHSRSCSIKAILQPMPKVTGSLRTKFEKSFIIKAAKLWNTLPPKLTQVTDLIHFKAGLDKFLCDRESDSQEEEILLPRAHQFKTDNPASTRKKH